MKSLLFAFLLCATTASARTADPIAPANFYLDFETDIDGIGKVRDNTIKSDDAVSPTLPSYTKGQHTRALYSSVPPANPPPQTLRLTRVCRPSPPPPPTHIQVTLNITRALAPLGVDRLHALVADHFFDGAAFFRVDGGFVLQFGIAGTPAENAKWVNSTIRDDPVVVPNMVGALVLQVGVSAVSQQCLPKDACAPAAVHREPMLIMILLYDCMQCLHSVSQCTSRSFSHTFPSSSTHPSTAVSFLSLVPITRAPLRSLLSLPCLALPRPTRLGRCRSLRR